MIHKQNVVLTINPTWRFIINSVNLYSISTGVYVHFIHIYSFIYPLRRFNILASGQWSSKTYLNIQMFEFGRKMIANS